MKHSLAPLIRVSLLTTIVCATSATAARADLIRLTADRYTSTASVTILNPTTGLPETWAAAPVEGSLFGPTGVQPFQVQSAGQIIADDRVVGRASTMTGASPLYNEPGTSGFLAHAIGDGDEGIFSFDSRFDAYLAFIVSGQNTSLNLSAERTGTHAAAGYRLVDFTTNTTVVDRMLTGPTLPDFSFFAHDVLALTDQHSYGLWTTAAALEMTDPFAGIEMRTNADVVPTPEPATLLLLGSGAAGMAYRRRQSRLRASKNVAG